MAEEEQSTRDKVVGHLQREFCYRTPIDEITDDKHLEDDLRLDSLDTIELLMILEEDFDIELRSELWAAVETQNVGELVKMVQARVDGN